MVKRRVSMQLKSFFISLIKLRRKIITKNKAKRLKINYCSGLKIGKNVKNFGCTIKIKENVWIGDNTIFWGNGLIQIGKNTHIGENSWIYSSKKGGVEFGDDVNCAANLYLIDSDHQFKKGVLIRQQELLSKKVVISDDVWIAANVTILKGTRIGFHSVVGACSLCNKWYPDYSVICGVPALVVKQIN